MQHHAVVEVLVPPGTTVVDVHLKFVVDASTQRAPPLRASASPSSRVLKNPVRRRFVDRSGGCGAGIVAVSVQRIGRVMLSFDAACSRRGLLG